MTYHDQDEGEPTHPTTNYKNVPAAQSTTCIYRSYQGTTYMFNLLHRICHEDRAADVEGYLREGRGQYIVCPTSPLIFAEEGSA